MKTLIFLMYKIQKLNKFVKLNILATFLKIEIIILNKEQN